MNNDWPKLKLDFEEKKIIILAPHMDDEVIGCGGVILKLVSQNKDVYVVFMTDGTKGTTGNKSNSFLLQTRHEEAMKVKEIFGLKDIYFLNLEDRGEWNVNETLSRLSDIFSDVEPDAVFVTPSNDLHEDHRKTNALLKKFIESGGYKKSVYIYEVWTPINPNRVVNITKFIEKKIKAINSYESQLGVINYRKMLQSLSAYRACFIPIDGIDYAETFIEMSSDEFIAEEEL